LDQTAGHVRPRFPVTGGLDHLAAFFRLFAQRHELPHAVLRRPAHASSPWLGGGAALNPPVIGAAPPDGNGLTGGAPTDAADAPPPTGGKAGSLAVPTWLCPGSGAGNAPCARACPPAKARITAVSGAIGQRR